MRHSTLVICFVLVNVLLIMLVALFWLRAPLTELRRVQAALTLQEARYALKEQNIADYTANLETLAEYEADLENAVVMPYRMLADALSALTEWAEVCRIQENGFYTEEPVIHEADAPDGQYVMEIKASAVYTGAYTDIRAFIYTLVTSNIYYRIERLHIEMDGSGNGTALLNIDFSVYGETGDES